MNVSDGVPHTKGVDDSDAAEGSAQEPTEAAVEGHGAAMGPTIRTDRLKEAFAVKLSSEGVGIDLFRPRSEGDHQRTSQVVDELADDMLEIMKRMAALDAKSDALGTAVAQLKQLVEDSSRIQALEIDKLKEVLVSDRKELIGRSTFNALRPAIESLGYLRETYENLADHREGGRQAQTILDLLNGITQMLGYQAFSATPGDIFNPQTMECVGDAEGRPGTVVKVERPGYRAGNILVRPCVVLVGTTRSEQSEDPSKS